MVARELPLASCLCCSRPRWSVWSGPPGRDGSSARSASRGPGSDAGWWVCVRGPHRGDRALPPTLARGGRRRGGDDGRAGGWSRGARGNLGTSLGGARQDSARRLDHAGEPFVRPLLRHLSRGRRDPDGQRRPDGLLARSEVGRVRRAVPRHERHERRGTAFAAGHDARRRPREDGRVRGDRAERTHRAATCAARRGSRCDGLPRRH